jgi:hypothetical protein
MTMKKFKLFIIGLILSTGISCSDFLDQVPDEQFSNPILFKSKDDAVRVLTQAYSYWLNYMEYRVFMGNASDDLDHNWNDFGPHYKDMGSFGPADPLEWSHWGDYYEGIRLCQNFLARIDECQDEKLTEQERVWWKGEAEFLQAYYYFLLLQQYGPVIKIDHVYQGNEMEALIEQGLPRAHADTIGAYIDQLLVEAAGKLDITYSLPGRAGRANASAAWFLRSRLALYLASPLYNGQSSVTNPGKNYAAIIPTNHDDAPLLNTTFDAERWRRAMEITEQAIQVANAGSYDLMNLTAIPQGSGLDLSGYSNYKYNFAIPQGGLPSVEMIYYKKNFNSHNYGINSAMPVSWSGYSGVCPTIGHVEEYFMANGLMPEDDPAYLAIPDYQAMETRGGSAQSRRFMRREPRFYANILYPNRNKYSVRSGGTNADPTAITESETLKWGGETDDKCWFRPFLTGQDGFNAHRGRDFCNTGVLFCKWIAVTSTGAAQGDFAVPTFRYTELLLNYVEAAIEYHAATGGQAVAHDEIFVRWDAVRNRAGIPGVREAYARIGVTLTNDKLRELIRRERRVEMVGEAQRCFDNRRWLDAEREGGPKQGFDIYADAPGFYNVVDFESRYWDDKMYFWPIPQTEIDRNKQLKQNPLY